MRDFVDSAKTVTPVQILTQNTSKDAVPHKDMPFEVTKPKLTSDHIPPPENRHFGARFRCDLEFSPENQFNSEHAHLAPEVVYIG